jgi:hypothetical protein
MHKIITIEKRVDFIPEYEYNNNCPITPIVINKILLNLLLEFNPILVIKGFKTKLNQVKP